MIMATHYYFIPTKLRKLYQTYLLSSSIKTYIPIHFLLQKKKKNKIIQTSIFFLNLSQAVIELWPYIHKLTTEERMDGGRDKHDVYRTIAFNRSYNVLKVNPMGEKKNKHTVPNVCQNRRPYRTQALFQFSASPALILGTTENATFAHFMKKSMHLKTGFCQIIKTCSCY